MPAMRPARPCTTRRHLLVVAGGLVLGGRASGAARQGGSRADVPVPTVDLGLVGLGTDPTVTFDVRNTGSEDLTLTVGRLGPGLRLVSHDGRIAPGRAGVVRVAVDTFKAGATTSWTVPVTTNDPQRETMILQVRADVRAYILVMPPASRITYVQYEREGGTEHLIGAAGHEDFRVTRVDSPYPFVDASFEPAPDAPRPEGVDGSLWRVRLVIRRHAEVGPLHANVVVHTNHPQQPRAWLPVSGFVRPLLGVTPPRLVVPATTATGGGAAPTHGAIVTNFAEAPLEVVETRSSLEGVVVTAVPIEPGRRWRLEVRATGPAGAATAVGEVTIRTSRDEAALIRVPIERR